MACVGKVRVMSFSICNSLPEILFSTPSKFKYIFLFFSKSNGAILFARSSHSKALEHAYGSDEGLQEHLNLWLLSCLVALGLSYFYGMMFIAFSSLFCFDIPRRSGLNYKFGLFYCELLALFI